MSPTAVVLAAGAGGQVQFRSIKMSDSGVSGGAIITGVGSGTNVSYRVTFTSATAYTLKGIVIDFCSGTGGTPFIEDANCPAPAGFYRWCNTNHRHQCVYGQHHINPCSLQQLGRWLDSQLTKLRSNLYYVR